ncbi:MAG: hypothetical protein LC778_16105, partial [Acidobacteria bacterium]|nr:hypothetical protein [Acidobacteriota bacterium]
MKKAVLVLLFGIIVLTSLIVKAEKQPVTRELKLICETPAEFPSGISAIAYDGKKIWAASYLDKGRYATFNPQTQEWKFFDSEKERKAIGEVTGTWSSGHGMTFI